ncbi:Uncharacterized protein FWK35_00011232 [Aphis craccivora]|uniref:Uncharacterized protein n=1 Tax=Aphis craccivora TaxID=307492 RepID=A0A6G0ZCZ6_APHCR|nr:Uncharacterized protein FWK35_00011232 [Aphis craccivora]
MSIRKMKNTTLTSSLFCNDECIDFTMIFCVSVYSISSRNNAPISNFGEVKSSKHFLTVFKKIEKNKEKNDGKREFLRKTSFRPN